MVLTLPHPLVAGAGGVPTSTGAGTGERVEIVSLLSGVGRSASTAQPVDELGANGVAARGIGLRLLAAGVGVGLGAGGAAGIGWYYSSMLLDPTRRPVFPERVLAADATR